MKDYDEPSNLGEEWKRAADSESAVPKPSVKNSSEFPEESIRK